MEVAVIGGGVVGVCSAYFLAAAGHEVTVFERNSSVGEEASFANAGLLGPGYTAPWLRPNSGSPLLSALFSSRSPLILSRSFDRQLWRWLKQWRAESQLDRYKTNWLCLHRLADYSHALLSGLREHHQIDDESTPGLLRLLRTEKTLQRMQPLLDLMTEQGIPHKLLEPEAIKAVEPALSTQPRLHSALHLPNAETANCALLTKHLKMIAQNLGVQFRFKANVISLARDRNSIALRVNEETLNTDAVVIATGAASTSLLKDAGLSLPLYPVKGYSLTVTVKEPEFAPISAVIDETRKVAITRIGNRVRVAGLAGMGALKPAAEENALHQLLEVAEAWFPNAANYNTSSLWSGQRAMLPDEVPLLGETPTKGVYLNIGHGESGWSLAAGTGKIIADLVSDQQPDIDMEGLTATRLLSSAR